MTDNLTFKGEAMLLSWSDSAAGRKVTFLLPDDGTPHPFKDYKTGPKYGQGFALGCQAIDYDNPEGDAEPKPGDPVKSVKGYAKPPMTEAQRCGMLCADKAFQNWLRQYAHADDEADPADIMRALLGIDSRSQIDSNHATREAWRYIFERFEADTGRVATQRTA